MYRQMRYFIAVVETNSFFEAGEVCHISQSAVSQQIKALEAELQVQLLERHGRKVTVTPAGRYFYEQAKRQTAALDSLVREVRRIGRGEYQRLRIGVLSGFSSRIMQKAIADFAADHPHVHLRLTTGTHEALFSSVISGAQDITVSDQWRALADHFNNEPLLTQPLYALMRRDDPLIRNGRAEAEDLADRLCILVSPPEHRESETVHWRDSLGLRSGFLFVDNVDEARMNAAAGTGFYPCDEDMPAEDGTVLVPLYRGGQQLMRNMFAFWPKEGDSSLQWELAEALRRCFQ